MDTDSNRNPSHKSRDITKFSHLQLSTLAGLALLLAIALVALPSCGESDQSDSPETVRPQRATTSVTTATGRPMPSTPEVAPTMTPTSPPHTTPVVTIITVVPPIPTPGENFEAQVRQLINQERTSRDLSELFADRRLQSAAEAHSRYMAQHQVLGHTGADNSTPGERITAHGYNWIFYAENVACGYFSPQDLVQGWMQSEGHRENILHPEAQEIGVGLVFDPGTDCIYYWTAEFAVTD